MTSPEGQLLGNAHGIVDIDVSGVTTSLDQAKSQFNNFIQSTGQSMQQWGNQIRNIGLGLSAAMAPAGLAFNRGLEIASDFDSVMTEIQARTGLTADAMKEIEQAAIDTGAASVFSSQQVADAFLQMLTAGLDTKSALATLPAVVNAAAAGNIDLGRAADLATNVMSVFNLTADDTEDIIDAIVRASASSPASFGEMGEAMQRAGGMAKRFGLDVNETAAALAIMANNGVRGSEAGTAFNSMLRNITRDTPGVTAAWEELGVKLYDAQGNVRDLDLVFGELDTSLKKLPIEDQNRLIQELAGSEGAAAFNALLLSDGIGAMQEQMAGQASAADVAAKQMDTYKQVVNSLAGSVETLAITVFRPFMNEVLKPQLKQMIEHVNALTKWASENEELVITILKVFKKLMILGPALAVAGTLISAIGSAIGFILSPMTLLIATVGLLATAFVKDFMGIRTALMPIINWLIDFFAVTYQQIRLFISDIQNFGLGEAIMGIFGKGTEAKGSLLRGWLTGIGFSRKEAVAINKEVLGVFTEWFPKINTFFIQAQRTFSSSVEKVRAVFEALSQPISAETFGNLQDAGFSKETSENILRTIRDIRAAIVRFGDDIAKVMDRIRNAVGYAVDFIREVFSILIYRDFKGFGAFAEDSGIANFFFNLRDSVTDTFTRIKDVVSSSLNWFSGVFERLTFMISVFVSDVQNFGLAEAIRGIFGTGEWERAESTLEGFLVALGFTRDEAISIVATLWTNFTTLRDTVVSTFNRIRNAVTPVFREIGIFISNNIDKITEWGKRIFDIGMRLMSLTSPIGVIKTALEFFGIDVLDVFERIMQGIADFFATLNQGGGFGDAIGAMFGGGGGTATAFMQGITDGFNSLVSFINDTALPALQNFGNWFLVTALPAIVNFITGTVIPSIGGFFAFLANLWSILGPPLMLIAEWFLVTALPAIIGAIAGLVDWLANTVHLGEILANVFLWLTDNIAVVLIPALAWLAVSFAPIIAIVGAVIGAVWLLGQAWSHNFLGIRTAIEWFVAGLPVAATAFSQLVQIIILGLQQIWTINQQTWALIVSAISVIWMLIQPHVQAIWDGIVNIFNGITTWIATNWDTKWNTFIGFFSGLWSSVSGGFDIFKSSIQSVFNWVIDNVIQPFIDMVNGIGNTVQNAVDSVQNAVGGYDVAGKGMAEIMSGNHSAGEILGAVGHAFGFAQGINFVPEDMPAIIHQGEAVVPAHLNPYNPNAQQNGLGGETKVIFEAGSIVLSTDSPEQAAEIGEAFGDGFKRSLRNNGVILS